MVDKHVVIPSLLMQGTLAVGWLYLFLLNWILLFANGAVEHRAFPFHPSHAHNTWKATNHNKAESFKGSLLWHCLPAFIPVPSQSLQKPTKREMDAGENNKKLKKKYKIKGLSQRNKDKQALKLVSGWRRNFKELGLNENNSVQSQIAEPFPDNFSQNQDKTETLQISLEGKIMSCWMDKRNE